MSKIPEDLKEVLHYHFYDYSKDEIINLLIERIPEDE